MSVHKAKAEYEVAYQDLWQLVSKHADKLSPVELLAIAANMVGKLIALQDQRTMLPKEAMQTVMYNIEIGNKEAIKHLSKSKGEA